MTWVLAAGRVLRVSSQPGATPHYIMRPQPAEQGNRQSPCRMNRAASTWCRPHATLQKGVLINDRSGPLLDD
jgi:hypothetical protein